MTSRLVIPILVLGAFGAGYGARVWTEQVPALPAPPPAGSEFVRNHPAPATPARVESKSGSGMHSPDRARLIAEIEKLRPQIDSYRKNLEEIDAEFDRAFAALLNPEQRERFAAQQKRDAERRAKSEAQAASTSPLSDEQISMLQQRPLWNALFKIAVSWRVDRAVRDYKLDEAQQAQVRVLLERRREKFIALVDKSPPPSIGLSQLANQTQKLVDPGRPAK